MITKRIIPRLNVQDGKVVGAAFEGGNCVASPVELAKKHSDGGADELIFYNVTSSIEGKTPFLDVLKEVTRSVFIPLTVGGEIRSIADFERALACGADKVSVNSGAIENPSLVEEAAKKYGDQCVVICADVRRVKGEYHIFTGGGIVDTGLKAIEWIKRCVDNGAGEVVVNSMDADGIKKGFDIELLKKVCAAVKVPVIASGGANCVQDFVRLFTEVPDIDAGLASSVFHFGEIDVEKLKKVLLENGVNVRRSWS